MRGAALSDLHLGFRQFSATEDGRNAREVDVERALERAVENVLAADPDLVTIAGDVVHHPRVGTAAEIALRDAVRTLRDAGIPVIMLQGNHDAVKTASARSPIWIPADYDGVHVVATPKRIRLEIPRTGEQVAVACFPYTTRQDGAEEASWRLDPDPQADVNVLCLHGAVKGDDGGDALPWFYAGGRALDVGREADRWDVIHCGDYHDFRRLHPEALAFYSGAIERTSSNIWDEAPEKGIVVYDTVAEQMVLSTHEVRDVASYEFVELTSFEDSLGPGAVNDALIELSTWQIEGDVVRLLVEDFARGQRDQVDWEMVRELKHRCLHFQLDLRWADRDLSLGAREGAGTSHSLADEAEAFFEDDPPAVQSLALGYLGVDVEKEPEQGDVLLICPNCGNRDTSHPGDRPPCSGGCGSQMVPDVLAEVDNQPHQLTAGGVR